MTPHDQARKERAENCNRESLESLANAICGLQSTDDPSLNDLHDELMERYLALEKTLEEDRKIQEAK